MQVKIHRGAHEIGGSCVEVESHGSRIVLDVGKPLWAEWNEQVPLPWWQVWPTDPILPWPGY